MKRKLYSFLTMLGVMFICNNMTVNAQEISVDESTGYGVLLEEGVEYDYVNADYSTEDLSPETIYNRMIALKADYPEGMRWTNDDFYRWNGGIYYGGYGCAGFAFMLSDAAFGNLPARILEEKDFASIRVGDILRVASDTHSVIVLEVYKDYVIIAEGNSGGRIRWGGKLTKDVLEGGGLTYIMTRYPEDYEYIYVSDIVLTKKETLEVSDTKQLVAKVYPDNVTDARLIWESSDNAVVTVDANGLLTGVAPGTATITATARDRSGVSASCEVTVKELSKFADVPENEWFYTYVNKAYDNGYMSGTGNDSKGRIIFKPLVNIPREQFVTVLYALEGVDPDSIQYTGRFTDVKESDWFAKPVEWAAQNGIVSGVADGEFGVGQEITREQMALMLFKYAGYKGYDVTVTADISSFPDVNDVSSWAMEAMRWAIQNGVMSGQQMGDVICLNPKAKASRAVCATMIVAFAGKYK